MNTKYFIYGVFLESNVDFPEFTACDAEQTDIKVFRKRWSAEGIGDLPPSSTLIDSHYRHPWGESAAFTYHSFPTHFVARWHQLCDFQVQRDGSQITCYPRTGAPWLDIKPFLMGRIIPLALNLRQVLTFHGGAVLSPQGTVGLIARSGMGKSTMVSSLACTGWPLVTDDVLAVREDDSGFRTLGGPAEVRLTTQAVDYLNSRYTLSAKPRPNYDKSSIWLRQDGEGTQAEPLRAIYFLLRDQENGDGINIQRIPPKEALPLLTRYISNRKLMEISHVYQYFGALTRLVGQVPIKLLEYPSGLEALPEVCQALREDCEHQSGPSSQEAGVSSSV